MRQPSSSLRESVCEDGRNTEAEARVNRNQQRGGFDTTVWHRVSTRTNAFTGHHRQSGEKIDLQSQQAGCTYTQAAPSKAP